MLTLSGETHCPPKRCCRFSTGCEAHVSSMLHIRSRPALSQRSHRFRPRVHELMDGIVRSKRCIDDKGAKQDPYNVSYFLSFCNLVDQQK